jgi:hypothetical protein
MTFSVFRLMRRQIKQKKHHKNNRFVGEVESSEKKLPIAFLCLYSTSNVLPFSTMGKDKKKDKQTAHVFIRSDEYAWVPAILDETKGDQAIVTVPLYSSEQEMTCNGGRNAKKGEQIKVDLKKYPHKVLPLQNVDGSGNLSVFADMVKLPYLHEVRIF